MIKEIAITMFKKSESLLIEYGEISLDALTSDPVIRELPVINTFVGLYKGAASVRDLYLAKKMYAFVKEIRSSSVSPEVLAKRLQAAKKGEKWLYEEVERLIVAIDRLNSEDKTKICAQLYIAYLNSYIKASDFEDMLFIVEQWLNSDTSQLLSLFQAIEFRRKPHEIGDGCIIMKDPTRCGRLVGLGVLCTKLNIVSSNSQIEYNVTLYGTILSEILKEGRVYTDYYKDEREARVKSGMPI